MIYTYRSVIIRGIGCLLLIMSQSVYAAQVKDDRLEVIPFGMDNQLTVDRSTGLATVICKGKMMIGRASAAFSSEGKRYQSKDYLQRSVSIAKINDKAGGEGTRCTIVSEGPGMPRMLQRFYCYHDKDFIVTEMEISGMGVSSNYMAPLISDTTGLSSGTELRSVFVPFDNDTFISYDARPLSPEGTISSEVGVIFDNRTRNGLILGSLTHDNWKTGVKSAGSTRLLERLEIWGGYSDVNVTRDSVPHGALKGSKITSPRMFIGYFSDWRLGMELFARTLRQTEPPCIAAWGKATPVGWNSWGVIKEHLTYEKAVGVADFFDKEIPAFRNDDGTAFIDLDSFWDNMVSGGLSGDFTRLKEFADYCRARHLEPGVYWAPFTDWGFRSARERIAEGSHYKFSEMWTRTGKGYHDLDGGRALDPTHPGTQKRIEYVIRKLKDCGFRMIKIDFLGHAAVEAERFSDPSITTGMQAYRVGMEYLTKALNNTMLVYAAISPSFATARYAHMRRIACDAWKSIEHTEYTLNSVSYGWWQTFLYDYIDADHLVFEDESIGANRARLISGLISGPVMLGDDYSKRAPWQDRIKSWLQQPALKELIREGKAFTPVEGDTGTAASPAFIRFDGNQCYLAVFNYRKGPANLTLHASRLGLEPGKKYSVTELLDNKPLNFSDYFKVDFSSEGAYLYRISLQ